MPTLNVQLATKTSLALRASTALAVATLLLMGSGLVVFAAFVGAWQQSQ